MQSAKDRVIDTFELLELILLQLPTDALLRARQVSRLWRSLISRSRRYKELCVRPYITLCLHLPAECSLSAIDPPRIQTTITLHYNRPLTVRTVATSFGLESQYLWYTLNKRDPAPIEKQSFAKIKLWRYLNRDRNQFNLENASQFQTLLPGIPYHESFELFYPIVHPPTRMRLLAVRLPDGARWEDGIGHTYVLKAHSGYPIPCFTGTKASLLARLIKRQDLRYPLYRLGKRVRVFSEGPVEFKMVP